MDIKKHIIGLGCSWTQGEGPAPEAEIIASNGRTQIRCRPDEHRRAFEHEHSWVNVMCRDHFKDHTPVNLGARGIGNRAAVKQLYFCDTVDWENSTGYIVFLLSGIERFDFFQQTPCGANHDNHYDGYSSLGYRHYKWRTMWPHPSDGPEAALWSVYSRDLWSEAFVCGETLLALLELQMFCKRYGYKMVVANAFNQVGHLDMHIKKHTGKLHTQFDWSTYLHSKTDYVAMVQKLVQLDGVMNPKNWGGYYGFYEALPWPQKYMTNDVHPNIDGYKVIAEEIVKFIKST